MLQEIINRVMSKAIVSCKAWAHGTDDGATITLAPKDGSAPVFLDANHVVDGLESFAEFNLRSDDAKRRDVSRKIQREQWGGIKLNNKIINAIIQHGVFGDEVY